MTESGQPPPPAVAETHVSVLFFVGDRAYKLKKPVSLGFLDFGQRQDREIACHREVELNRRFAPDVYLGVLDVYSAAGEVCDHLVEMRRMPAERRLATLIRSRADVGDGLREVARAIARFHSEAPTSAEIAAAASRDAVLANWEENFSEMQPFVGPVLDGAVAKRVEGLARRYLAGREHLFKRRMEDGFVRDGHGDLLTEDIFLLDDGPRILDCLEFSDRYRFADVLADIAFLAMDLERLHAPQLAERLLNWYDEFSGHTHPRTLAEHYIAYRAHVRTKVACLRHSQGDYGAARQACELLEITTRHLERGRVSLVLVGGPPGTGKSTLAQGLADALRSAQFSTDEVRKDLAGMGHEHPAQAPFGEGLYAPVAVDAVYGELLRRARSCLELGLPVVLDASWARPGWRQQAARLASDTFSDLVELRCSLPIDLAMARIAARAQTPSDATPRLAARLAAEFEDWPSALAINNSLTPEHALREALTAVGGVELGAGALAERWRSEPPI